MLEPYAIVTARNVVASMWRGEGPPPAQPAPRRRPATAPSAGRGPARAARSRRRSPRRSSGSRERERRDAAGPRGRRAGHRVAGRRAGLARRAPWPRSSTAPGPGCGSSTCWPSSRSSRRPTGAGRCCWRCPAATGAASGRSTPPGTCSSATSAPGSASRCSSAGQQRDDEVRIPISGDADIVAARQAARELAARGRLHRHRPDPDRHRGLRGRPQHRPVRRAAARSSSSCSTSRGRGIQVVARDTGPGHPGRRAGARATATAPTTAWASGCPAPAG